MMLTKLEGIAARTDYVVNGKHDLLLFLTAAKSDGKEGRPLCARTTDGGNRDIGYPRSVQRPDGKVVTVYYFNDHPKGDRYIAATIWDPGRG